MLRLKKNSLNSFTIICCFSLLICAFLCSNVYSSTKGNSTYHELRKDGRIYVFTSLARKESFEKSGELGKGIIKIGYGPNNETVVFDSDDAIYDYDYKQLKQAFNNLKLKAYKEFEKDGRIYVFTSPERKASFDKSGEMGKDFIAKIGYSSDGKTVMFDSHDAIKEYEKRHKKVSTPTINNKDNYHEIRKNGRVYVFTSHERMDSFKNTGETGKCIIKVGYGTKGETVIFDTDEAVKEFEKRNIK